ncbi:MAG TPA: NAD-glutamate dehydrogenase, partial [Xanthomonadaceae bacterium]|nr:NAD-glutamate dehydrogenase [Xanthomonadaceae bacterium]
MRRKVERKEPEKPLLLDPVFAAIRKLAGKTRQEDAAAFAQAFYHRMGEDELPLHTPEGWAALANDFLEFARNRKPGSPAVRLFNPTLKQHGWETPHTVVQIVNDDMPFLVDSVTMALAEQGIGVHVLGHPVLQIARDRAGRMTAIGSGSPESLMHLEIDRQSADDARWLEAGLRSVLANVRAIVEDWPAMRERMIEVADDIIERHLPVSDEGRREAQEFLRWAADDHFTFLGYREYEVVKKDKVEVL